MSRYLILAAGLVCLQPVAHDAVSVEGAPVCDVSMRPCRAGGGNLRPYLNMGAGAGGPLPMPCKHPPMRLDRPERRT